MKNFDMQFSYNGQTVYAIVRAEENLGGTYYHVSVRNADDRLLSAGSHIIREADGYLYVDEIIADREQNELKLKIAANLSGRLKMPCFVDGKYALRPDGGNSSWTVFHPIAKQKRS